MKKLLTVLLCTGSFLASAQTIDTSNVPIWVDMMQDPNANFYETQRAFELYWEDRERTKGDGWKVFKRWEWFWEQRIDENGNLPSPGTTHNAYEQWRIAYNQSLSGTESTNGTWTEVGPRFKPQNGTGQPNGNGRLNYIAFHPTDTNIMYVGSPSGGFWITENGGTSWRTTTDALATLGVSSILVNQNNPDSILIGTGDRDAGDAAGMGVYASVDGGENWFVSNTGMGNLTVGQMIAHPNDPNYILAATSSGIYRSQDGGANWTSETGGDNYKDIRFKPDNPNVVYATETSGGANFWRSTDGGDTWTMINTGLPSTSQRYSIGVTPDNPDVVYLLRAINSEYGGLYKSTDAGLSFTLQSSTPNILTWSETPAATGGGGQGWYDLCIAVDPNDEKVVYVGGVNIFKSIDGGVTWDCAAHWVGSATAASVHADHHWLAYSPLNNRLYNCNDGGLYYTADEGVTWPEISDSLGTAQIYKIGVSSNTDELVINGYQDNGTAIWDDEIFRTERGGDGMECAIDPSNDNIIYATVYFGDIARSFDNGVSFGGFANTNVISESGGWVTPFLIDKNDPETMFIGYKNVWRTSNAYAATPTFTAISNNLAGSNSTNMRQLRLSQLDSDRLYAIRSDNKLFRTDNAHAASPSWVDLTSNLPSSGHIADIETSAFDVNTVWIIRNNGVYESNNNGSTWTNITQNLPSLDLNCLVDDPYSNNGLYVGTDAGIYYIDDDQSGWVTFDNGFPANARVTELEIYHAQGNIGASKIRASTYGRGLWESDLYDPGTNPPAAFMNLSIDSSDICSYDTIQLFNNTAYGVDSLHWTITPSSGVSFVNGTNAQSSVAEIVIDEVGTYDVYLYVQNSNGSDSVLAQDAITISAGVTLPLYEDFEDNDPCSTGGCQVLCNAFDWINLPNGSEDDTDWRTDFGGTPSSNTGPSVDFDPGTSNGNYMYIEASWCTSQTAILESPCISLNNVNAPELRFAYHRNGLVNWMEDLEVELQNGSSITNLMTISGVQGNDWQLDSIDLSAYLGNSIKLRFKGSSGSEWQADMAIDGISVHGIPDADFIVNDTNPCMGATTIFYDQSSQNPTSWNWTITPNTYTFVNGTNANSQNIYVQFNANSNYTISLNASNAEGSNLETKTNYVLVNDPDPDLQSGVSNNHFCEGDTVTVYAIEGMLNYVFKRNGVLFQQGPQDTAFVINPMDQEVIEVTVTDTKGCTAIDTLTLLLIETPISLLTCNDEDLAICDGDSVTFTNTGSGVDWHAYYLQGNLVQADSINTWSTNALADQDSVRVEITDSNGCKGWSNSLLMTVLPLPATPMIQLVQDSLNSTVSGISYEWMMNDSNLAYTSATIEKFGDGDYFVRVFDGNCWSLWSAPLIITGATGHASFRVELFPSPAIDQLNLHFTIGSERASGNISILDMSGKTVHTSTLPSASENVMIPIDQLSSGVYHLLIDWDDERIALPFIKEKR